MNELDILLLRIFNPSMWSDGLVAIACFVALRALRSSRGRRRFETSSPEPARET